MKHPYRRRFAQANCNVYLIDEQHHVTGYFDGVVQTMSGKLLPGYIEQTIALGFMGKTPFLSAKIDGETHLTTGMPIMNARSHVLGVVLLESTLRELGFAQVSSSDILLVSGALAFVLTVLLGALFSRMFTQPITAVQRFAGKLAGGEYEARMNSAQRDEIGELARSMDILARRLFEARSRDERLREQQSAFFATISHELKTPVTVIRGSLEALRDGVVSGGQTMNPSTESILEGVDKIPAETVFVLPNNGNIIMAAQQCDALTDKHVVVIPSKTVPQGITAMMNVDFEAPDAQSITDAMTESLSTVTTAQITYAARDSDFDGFDIKAGDYLALQEGKLFGTDGDLNALLHALAQSALEHAASFISLYFGEDVTEEDANAAAKVFEETCPEAEVAVLSGGQPVYYYIISME